MSKKTPGIKIPYLKELQYPIVEGTRCVEVRVPDDPSFMPLLAGLVAIATKGFNYERKDYDHAQGVAAAWRAAYLETDWEGCMNCQDVADCITNNPETQEAFRQLLMQLLINDSDVQAAAAQGVQQHLNGQNPLSSAAQNGNTFEGLPGCANNNRWAAIEGFVDWMHRNNEDMLDRLAVAATPAQRSAALSKDIPGFSGGALGSALSSAMTFLSGAMVNNYDAFYDQPYADGLACELFCISEGDCTLTLRQVYLVLAARVGYTPTADLFYQGLIFAALGSWVGVNFCDVMMFLQVGAHLFMGGFAGYIGINPITNAMSQGWDLPNDGWMTKCDCPDTWTYILDSATLPAWVTFPPEQWGEIDGETLTQTTAIVFSQDVTGIYVEITFPTIQTLTGLSIHQVAGTGIDVADIVNAFAVYRDAGGVNIGGTGIELPRENGAWDASYSEAVPGVKNIVIQYLFLGTAQTMEWQPIIISGFGTNPFI